MYPISSDLHVTLGSDDDSVSPPVVHTKPTCFAEFIVHAEFESLEYQLTLAQAQSGQCERILRVETQLGCKLMNG